MGHVVYKKEIEQKVLIKKIVPIAVSVIGLCVMIGGICFFLHVSKIEKEYKPVKAKIENIEKHTERRNGETRTNYDVTVGYQVDGKEYRSELSEYSSSMEIGGDINLMYNPADPSEVHSTEIGKVISIVMIAAGALVLLMYWLLLHRVFRKVLLKSEKKG